MGILDFLFGKTSKKVTEFLERDAVILDVRTKSEFGQGAIEGSKNIPLQQIQSKMETIKKWGRPVITCCASGVRSGNAARALRSQGIEAVNGGGWRTLSLKL